MGIETAAMLAISAGSAMYKGSQQKKYANKAMDAANSLQYEPIDIAALQKQATDAAFNNAKKSLENEAALTPDIAAARGELSSQVNEDLARGGNLSADLSNQVSKMAMADSNVAGVFGSAPLTAARLGMTSMGLRDKAQQKASALLAANPLAESGLSPSALANLTIADKNAKDKFNMDKLGAVQNANNAQGVAANSMGDAFGNIASSAIGSDKMTSFGKAGIFSTKPPVK